MGNLYLFPCVCTGNLSKSPVNLCRLIADLVIGVAVRVWGCPSHCAGLLTCTLPPKLDNWVRKQMDESNNI